MAKKESKSLVSTWHIYDMELWDEDYFNMEVQAYITVMLQAAGDFNLAWYLEAWMANLAVVATPNGSTLPGKAMTNAMKPLVVVG